MKITMIGTGVKHSEEVELTIEYQGGNGWCLKTDKEEFVVTDLEKSIKILKEWQKTEMKPSNRDAA